MKASRGHVHFSAVAPAWSSGVLPGAGKCARAAPPERVIHRTGLSTARSLLEGVPGTAGVRPCRAFCRATSRGGPCRGQIRHPASSWREVKPASAAPVNGSPRRALAALEGDWTPDLTHLAKRASTPATCRPAGCDHLGVDYNSRMQVFLKRPTPTGASLAMVRMRRGHRCDDEGIIDKRPAASSAPDHLKSWVARRSLREASRLIGWGGARTRRILAPRLAT
jgi:hypothetical protein